MVNLNVYMVVWELDTNKGGMTTAILTRSKVFNENGIKNFIVTFDYKENYDEVISKLIASGKMDSNSRMINMYKFFEKRAINSHKNKIKNDIAEEEYWQKKLDLLVKTSDFKGNNNQKRYFDPKTGVYKYYVRTENQHIKVIDEFDNDMRRKRLTFYNGKLKKISIFLSSGNIREILFTDQGNIYISRYLNPNGGVYQIDVFNENLRFANHDVMAEYFWNNMLNEDESNIVILDGPGSFGKIQNITKSNVKKFAVIHTNHYSDPLTKSKIKKEYQKIFEQHSFFNKLIFFTNKQLKDAQSLFHFSNGVVLPNFVNFKENSQRSNSNIIGSVSRLNKDKGFDRMLKIAGMVHELRNDISFEIWGSGNPKFESELQQKINKMDGNTYIKLMGYTSNITTVLPSFNQFISTSHFEAMGLSIIEAMSQTVPVISFDIDYGPSDFIMDGENGFLIKNDDLYQFSDKIIKLFDDKNLNHDLGVNARNDVLTQFDTQKLMLEWKQYFFE